MRYVSAYRNSPYLTKIFRLLQILVLFVPFVIILFIFVFIRSLGKNTPALPPQMWLLVALMVASGLFTYFFMRTVFTRLLSLSVEVTADGIHHIAPGNPRTILWQDVTEVRRVPYGKGQSALQVRTPHSRYTFNPLLVPDSPDTPRMKFGLAKQEWVYSDGRTEPGTLEHSFAYKVIREYRPELLK